MKPRAQALKAASAQTTAFQKYGLDAIRRFVTLIKAQLALGKPDWEIAEELKLTWKEYNDIKREMYKWDTAALYDRPVEQQYIDYVVRQEAIIQDLNTMLEELKGQETASAAQSRLRAIKAKSEILDKIIKTGQNMGILEKAPERQQVIGGMVVAHLTSDELREAVAGELTGLNDLVEKYGDASQPPNPEGHDQLPVIEGEAKKVEKPQFSEDKKPFFARNAASRAQAAKSARSPKNIKRTKVTRSS